ncbi:MAG: linear amide C-N hydrolase, partial [Christensenella sp.]|uniref:linear amide C-N hydrolase n=1 Tax=Christensenella sp. TaxID=1935934 RepID=UPI002B1EC8FC
MCTALTLQTMQKENFFGRSMDFSYAIDPSIYAVPGGREWRNLLATTAFQNEYSFIGVGQELNGNLTFADGVNEKGFAAATLYFPGYAHYGAISKEAKRPQLAALEVVHYLLGRCSSTDDVQEALAAIEIVSVPDPITNTVAPLHWIVTDRRGRCLVAEQTEQGLRLWDNEIGVLTNSPDFPWHMTNLRNYMSAVPQQHSEVVWGKAKLRPFGNASGTDSLPGGYTPPARFVRT